MAALVQEATAGQQKRGTADGCHRNLLIHETADCLDEPVVPGLVVVPSRDDQGCERAVVGQST